MMSSLAGPIRNTSPRAHTTMGRPTVTAPRPPNAWILYRSDKLKSLPPAEPGVRRAQADVSRLLSDMWKSESEETRAYYERLADEKKAEHSIKYPGYRFQPMKKEEKAALREQKKQDKVLERKARQKQQRSRQTPAAQPSQQQVQPAPSTPAPAQPPPLQPPPPTFIAAPTPTQHTSLYPTMTHLYLPMDVYGSAGPSPSLSWASSPTPEPTPDSGSDESYEFQSNQPPSTSTNASSSASPPNPPLPAPPPAPSGTNPYLAILGPAATQQMFSSNPTVARRAPVPPYANNALPAALPNGMQSTEPTNSVQYAQNNTEEVALSLPMGQGMDGINMTGNDMGNQLLFPDHNVNPYNFEGLSFPAFNNQQITFNVGDSFFNNVADLLPEGSDCHNTLEAMRIGADIFALSNFPNTTLDANPGGELIVEMGSFGQYEEFDFGNFINHGMLDSGSTMAPNSFERQQPADVQDHRTTTELVEPLHPHMFEFVHEGMHSGDISPSTASHPSMPPTPAVTQVALSVDLSNTDNSCRGGQTYVPPTGAPLFASRRVAGSWKPPHFVDSEGSLDELSPCNSVSRF